MNIIELVRLPIEEFKRELGKLNKEEYLLEINEMNILRHAFYALNIDVINYLTKNNLFDLEKELMNENFLRWIPFIPISEAIFNKQTIEKYLTEEKLNNYIEILNLINKKGIDIPKLSERQLRENLYNEEKRLAAFSEPLLSYLLNNKYLDCEYVIDNFDFIYENNNDYKTIEKIITNENFKPIISNEDRLSILLNNGNKFDVKNKIYNKFLLDLKNDYLKVNNLSQHFFEIKILKERIKKVLCSTKDEQLFKKIIKDFSKIKTIYKKDKNLKFDINNSIMEKLNILLYENFKNSFSFFNEDEMFLKRIMEKSVFKENPSFFYNQISANNFNILKYFKDLKTEEMRQYRVCWLYYYLSEKEDDKIRFICNERQGQGKEFFETLKCKSVESDLNLIFEESIFYIPVYFMSYEFYRNNKEYLRKYESLTKDDLLLTYLFNSKLSFSEIESNIKNIKGNESFDLKNLLTNFICKESEKDFKFLYEKSSSFEKIEFLRTCGIEEPTNFNTLEVMHNCILNNDMDFIKYEINKICNVNENDFVNFLNDIELYAKYNEGKKEAIFVITIIEDIFKIFELKESSDFLTIKNLKVHLEKLHERTIQYYAENIKWKKEDVIDFKSIKDQWVLMEKNMISKQIINKIKINTRNRL